jgi:hypothetical protein
MRKIKFKEVHLGQYFFFENVEYVKIDIDEGDSLHGTKKFDLNEKVVI